MSFLKPGLFNEVDRKATGKTEGSIAASRTGRDELVLLFGNKNLPSSIMVRQDMHKIAELDDEAAGSYKKTQGDYGGELNKIANTIKVSGSGLSDRRRKAVERGEAEGALSVFPQNVGRTVLLFYSKPGDLVIDPFAGHNSRMQLVVKEGRHYTAYDVSERFMQFNKKRAEQLRNLFPSAKITLHQHDSREQKHTKSNTGDFTLTSPPYWDIEFYGNEPEQLGLGKTYEAFMQGIEAVLQENFRVLKPGAFSCWFINDFRRMGKMYFYHIDLLQAGERAGFISHDIAIVDFGTGLRDVFINQAFDQKILPKRHEYCIVFRKPLK